MSMKSMKQVVCKGWKRKKEAWETIVRGRDVKEIYDNGSEGATWKELKWVEMEVWYKSENWESVEEGKKQK